MGAGIAAIGAIASLGQMGYGLYQADQSKKAMEKSLAEAKNQPKAMNSFENMRIANEAYASQEQQNAQTEANLIDAITQSGASAVIGGVPKVQQQLNALSSDLTSRKAQDLQNIELQKANAQQGIDNDYVNWQKQLNMMELQGAGAANSQANQMIWQGVGGLSNVASAYAMGQQGRKANPNGIIPNNQGSYISGNAINYPQQTQNTAFGSLPYAYSNPTIPQMPTQMQPSGFGGIPYQYYPPQIQIPKF